MAVRCRSTRPAAFRAILRPALLAAVSAALFTWPAAAQTPPSPQAAKAAAIRLAANEQLAHPVVAGRLGPWPRAEVWLTQSTEVDDAPFRGRVVVGGTPTTMHPLPSPDETESGFLMKVRSVMFRPVDVSPARALIVLYSATRIGPQQSPSYGACVYRWTGREFVRLRAVEQRLAGARTAAEVTHRLSTSREPR